MPIADEMGFAEAAWYAAERGDLSPVEAALARLRGLATPVADVWRRALAALGASYVAAEPPSDGEALLAFADGDPAARAIACRVAIVAERASVLAVDAASLERWIAVHRALQTDEDVAGGLAFRAALLWRALFAGRDVSTADADALFEQASRARLSSVVVEIAALRALQRLDAGDLVEANTLARRCAHMAQAEALPVQEYLAALVVARVRRYRERPHLALHVLGALAQVAPPLCRGWIAWETVLAGGEGRAAALLESAGGGVPIERGARGLLAVLASARAGDRGSFDAAADAVAAATGSSWRALADEGAALASLLDPRRASVLGDVQEWRAGVMHRVPRGLHGAGATDAVDAAAVVLGTPGRTGVRVLAIGVPLAGEAAPLSRRDPADDSGGVRTETALAVLALAGPDGLDRDQFFQLVYGFDYAADLHQDVLNVLVHRMRTRLADRGELLRDGSMLSLRLRAAMAVADARTALPLTDRILRALASLGAVSAREAADALHTPLRQVQNALRELVDEGSCRVERDGRRVAYALEDTVFTKVVAVDALKRPTSTP